MRGLGGSTEARREGGFTLIELAVVTLIIAILAGLAVSIFLRQRERAKVAQVQAALASARVAAESYRVEGQDSFLGMTVGILHDVEGLRTASTVTITDLKVTQENYCVIATNFDMAPGDDWQIASLQGDLGEISPADVCPAFGP
jgi:prepilin-type N-terminal cleavage/methylation domain-containing protein